jgi:hypothetical protein
MGDRIGSRPVFFAVIVPRRVFLFVFVLMRLFRTITRSERLLPFSTFLGCVQAPFYPKMGRPSVDPVLMIRMLVVGYVFAIRSERALCREVHCAPRDRCRASAPFDQKPPPIDG